MPAYCKVLFISHNRMDTPQLRTFMPAHTALYELTDLLHGLLFF